MVTTIPSTNHSGILKGDCSHQTSCIHADRRRVSECHIGYGSSAFELLLTIIQSKVISDGYVSLAGCISDGQRTCYVVCILSECVHGDRAVRTS